MSQSARKRAHSSNESIHYALNDYDRHRRPQTLIDDDRIQRVSIEPVLKSLSCPICLDLLNQTMVTTNCLHRFCAACIHRWLKSESKACPTCRKTLKSKRYLRSDALTDSLVELIKQQQTKTNDLASLYREQEESHD